MSLKAQLNLKRSQLRKLLFSIQLHQRNNLRKYEEQWLSRALMYTCCYYIISEGHSQVSMSVCGGARERWYFTFDYCFKSSLTRFEFNKANLTLWIRTNKQKRKWRAKSQPASLGSKAGMLSGTVPHSHSIRGFEKQPRQNRTSVQNGGTRSHTPAESRVRATGTNP